MSKVKGKKKRPSMKDVANLAGVSRTTVSFVINDTPNANIPTETRQRVWDAVNSLGYRPNAVARNLRSQRTQTIGLISDEIATTPHAGQIIQGAQDEAWKHNQLLLLINTGTNRELRRRAVNMMLDRQVDGIIYATMFHREVFPVQAVRDVPVVLLDCFVGDRSLPSVVPDETGASIAAVTHLIERGHRRIGFLNNSEKYPAHFLRLAGYQAALQAAGIPFDPSLVVERISDTQGGYTATDELLNRPVPPTAIFCFSDRMAMGTYEAARKHGLSIPNDLSIVGFDDQELIAAHLVPPLTSMRLPHYEMGAWAVAHLLERMQDETDAVDIQPVQHLLPCPLILREST